MSLQLPTLIATSVVRGSQQGESHGGVYTLDFENQKAEQRVDWNTSDINFDGRGADRGLRGIGFDNEKILIAASDELFCYNQQFEIQTSWRNRYLNHCHEICRKDRVLFLTSTGYDSLLAFDLTSKSLSGDFTCRNSSASGRVLHLILAVNLDHVLSMNNISIWFMLILLVFI